MIYPFFYQILAQVDVLEIKANLIKKNRTHTVWDDWTLEEVDSPLLRELVEEKFYGLSIFADKIFISHGTNSNFHIDRFHYYHLTHRILIPLDDYFHYEWIAKDRVHTFQPQVGQVILLNNMIPHRFVSHEDANDRVRAVIYFDLINPFLENHLQFFGGNNSIENGLIDANTKNFK